MTKWKATMPRGIPQQGKAQLVIGIKTDKGYRIEFSGEVDEQIAVNAFGKTPGFENIEFKKSR